MSNSNSLGLPWVEKYRPVQLEQIVGNVDTITGLKVWANPKNDSTLPHLLLLGPPGSGKTSCVKSLMNERYKTLEVYKQYILEINASEERSVESLTKSITSFCTQQWNTSLQSMFGTFRFVIMEEADNLLRESQILILKMMGNYSHCMRFIFTCNSKQKMMDSFHSRCLKLEFQPVPLEEMKRRLLKICESEKIYVVLNPKKTEKTKPINPKDVKSNPPRITLTDLKKMQKNEKVKDKVPPKPEIMKQYLLHLSEQALQLIMMASEGDMRKAIGFLQCVCVYFLPIEKKEKSETEKKEIPIIRSRDVYDRIDIPSFNVIRTLFHQLIHSDEKSFISLLQNIGKPYGSETEEISPPNGKNQNVELDLASFRRMISMGPHDLIQTMFEVCSHLPLSFFLHESIQNHFIQELIEIQKRIIDGVLTPLQWTGLLSRLRTFVLEHSKNKSSK